MSTRKKKKNKKSFCCTNAYIAVAVNARTTGAYNTAVGNTTGT
jgi:hypothetical protein